MSTSGPSADKFQFDHQLGGAFLTKLKELTRIESPQGVWWRDIITDPDLILAVRKDKLDFYYCGQSIFQIHGKAKSSEGYEISADTHFKYLVRQDQARVKLNFKSESEPVFHFKKDFLWATYELPHEATPKTPGEKPRKKPGTLKEMLQAAKALAGGEKTLLHDLIKGAHPETPVIDVEAHFTNQSSDNARFDVVTLEKNEGELRVVFHEAKLFTNPALKVPRDQDKETKNVIDQIKLYEATIKDHEEKIKESYRNVCRALLALDDIREQAGQGLIPTKKLPRLPITTRKLITAAAHGVPLELDHHPRLIIFGYDGDQARKDGPLENLLGRLKESASKRLGRKLAIFTIGTSSPAAFRLKNNSRTDK